jgi:hypothetical protein
MHGGNAMTASLRTWRGAERTAGLLTVCLLLSVLATAVGLPAVIRVFLGVPGVMLAPGYAWLTVAVARTGRPFRTLTEWVLAGVLSLAALPLVGVTINAVGLPVTPVSIGIGLLVVTLPPTVRVLHSSPARGMTRDGRLEVGRRDLRRAAPVVLSVAVFVAAVAWGASWQDRVDSGPYAQLGYVGRLQHLEGPVYARPGEKVRIPVQLERSDGRPWSGTLTVFVDGQQQDSRPARVDAGDVVPLRATTPPEPGLHDVLVSAIADGTGEELTLDLRLRVNPQ